MSINPRGPLVSVCITTYNHGAYIEQCIRSVLDQVFPGNLELLVGDDGSSDNTREIVAALAACDSRIRPFFHRQRFGPSGNLQALVAAARGDLIAHLDGDDFWIGGKLAAQVALLHAEPSIIAVYCNAAVLGPSDKYLGSFNSTVPAHVGLEELLRRGNFLNHSSLIYRARAKAAVLQMKAPFIDYRIHVRLARCGVLGYVDKQLVGHRWRTSGSMIRTDPTNVYHGHLDAFREALAVGASKVELRNAIGCFWGKLMIRSVVSRRPGDTLKWARMLLREREFGYTLGSLLADTLAALPRALKTWWHRKLGYRVYFP